MANTLLGAGKTTPANAAPKGRRWIVACAVAVAIAVLFFAYFGLSRTYPENSDEANILLMANDMLHGNVLLRHWVTSDVPFISTELPQIAALEGIFGTYLHTAHIAAAMTYTLVVVLGMLLARGPRRAVTGKTAIARMAVAGGIMLGPQTGVGVFILLLSVGHIGTAVPVMLTWLLVDRMGERPWVPAVVTLLLAWSLVADPLVKVVAIWPLMLVAVVRIATWLVRGERDAGENATTLAQRVRTLHRKRWFDLSLLAAAAIGWWIASLISTVISDMGGYAQNAVPYSLDPSKTWWPHARVSIDGLLSMFGADFVGQTGWSAVLAVLHLVGVVLAVWGVFVTLRWFFSWPGDLVSQVLVVAVIANLVAYIPSGLANATDLNAREFAVVLPFAAVVAGRQLGARLVEGRLVDISLPDGTRQPAGPRLRFLVPVLAVVLAGYAWTLGSGALKPPAPAPYTKLIAWLEAHHLRSGLGGYWQASVITVETGGQITIRALTSASATLKDGSTTNCVIAPYAWEIKKTWYVASQSQAYFILMDEDPNRSLVDPMGAFNLPGAALHAIGDYKHYQAYKLGTSYIVRAYQYNILHRIPVILPQQACLNS